MASRGGEPETIKVSLDLSGREHGAEGEVVSVKRLVSRSGVIHIILSLPQAVDAEQANLAVATLFDQIEQLPSNAAVDRVKMSGLRFTKEGVLVFREFLSTHAASVRHVSLKDILRQVTSPQDEAIFSLLAQAFRESNLEILNMSDNVIGAYMWRNWANQTGLRQLLLDHVEMDIASIKELASRLTYADALEDIYVVVSNPTGTVAVREACAVLAQCRNVTSVRWANRELSGAEAKLPWLGLRQMVFNQLEYNGGLAKLAHLVMDGSSMVVAERGNEGLGGALKELKQLRTLKLRDVGLRDSGVRCISAALQKSQPPLEWLDLSGNFIESGGAQAIVGLANVGPIISNIHVIALDRNQIDTESASQLMQTFVANAKRDFDFSMYENPVDFCKIALEMAHAKAKVESEQERSNAQQVHSFELQKELKRLQAECENLRKERDSLIATFSLVGVSTQVDEQRRLLDRIAKLEDMVTEPRTPFRATERGYSHQPSTRNGSNPLRRSSATSYLETPRSSSVPIELATPISRSSTLSSLSGIRGSLNDHGSFNNSSSSTSSCDLGQTIRRLPPSIDERHQLQRSASWDESSNAEVDNVHRSKQQLYRATQSASAASALSLNTPTTCSSSSSSSGSNVPSQQPRVYDQQRQQQGPQQTPTIMGKQKSIRNMSLPHHPPKPTPTIDSRRAMLQKRSSMSRLSSRRLLGDTPSSSMSSKDTNYKDYNNLGKSLSRLPQIKYDETC